MLEYILKNWSDNSVLSLKNLSLKLATLLLIAKPTRVSELTFIDLRSVKFDQKGVSFSYAKPLKNQHCGTLKNVSLSRRENDNICVVSCLEFYVQKTNVLRTSENSKKLLLISFRKPHNVVTPTTVSRWVQSVMSLSGVDTSVYKTHSSRSAVAAASKAQGFSLKQILDSAFWRSESTFRRFYDKEVG